MRFDGQDPDDDDAASIELYSPTLSVTPNINYVAKLTAKTVAIAGDGNGCSAQISVHNLGGIVLNSAISRLGPSYYDLVLSFNSGEDVEIVVQYGIYCDDSTATVAVDNVFVGL